MSPLRLHLSGQVHLPAQVRFLTYISYVLFLLCLTMVVYQLLYWFESILWHCILEDGWLRWLPNPNSMEIFAFCTCWMNSNLCMYLSHQETRQNRLWPYISLHFLGENWSNGKSNFGYFQVNDLLSHFSSISKLGLQVKATELLDITSFYTSN